MPQQSRRPRFPDIPRAEMSEAQRKLADRLGKVANGGTGGPQPFLLRSPEMAEHLHALIGYLLAKSPLPRRLTELAILMQARLWRQEYEWWAHEDAARQQGISNETIAALHAGRRPEALRADEAAVYDYVMELWEFRAVSDTTFARLRAALSETQLVDLTAVIGTYTFLSMALNLSEAGVPADAPTPLPGLET